VSKYLNVLKLSSAALPENLASVLEIPEAPPAPVTGVRGPGDRANVRPPPEVLERARGERLKVVPADASPKLRPSPPDGGLSTKLSSGLSEMEEGVPAVERVLPARIADAAALLGTSGKRSYTAEQYRIVRTKIAQLLASPFRLVVTSPSIGDGKTVTAINLSVALALKGEGRTLLVDADLRRPAVHRRLGIPQSAGLADVLEGTCRVEEAMCRVEQLPALYVLPSGEPRGNPTELFDSSRWHALADTLRGRFAHVIVDCPPVELVADYDLIAAACDRVVLVVRPDHTDRALCMAAVAKVRPKLAGVLINAVEEWFLWRKSARQYSYYSGRGRRSRGRHE
jgi:capsular exopolysaccharide synthesis family protein